MPRAPGTGRAAGFRPMAVLVGLALALVLFGVLTAALGLVYGLWPAVAYPRWVYLTVHAAALLMGGAWAGRQGASGGWLHGLVLGLLYVAAALWMLPRGGEVTVAGAGRALALALPLGMLGGAAGRNWAGGR